MLYEIICLANTAQISPVSGDTLGCPPVIKRPNKVFVVIAVCLEDLTASTQQICTLCAYTQDYIAV